MTQLAVHVGKVGGGGGGGKVKAAATAVAPQINMYDTTDQQSSPTSAPWI